MKEGVVVGEPGVGETLKVGEIVAVELKVGESVQVCEIVGVAGVGEAL